MSFKTASAILRGRWLVNKDWASSHMPLVFNFMKGDAQAGKMLMDWDDDDDDGGSDDAEPTIINGTKNVFEVCCRSSLSDLPYGAIAYLDISGPMLKHGDMCSDGMDDYAELMFAMQYAPNIAGVIIDIDTPGGQADGTASLAAAIKSLAAVKPVIGFVDDGICCSAGYWVLSACTEIYASQPTDYVGSVGVYCTVADWYAYYASQGLPVKDVYAPQSTEKCLDFRESIAGNDEPLKEDLAVIADAFISAVKTNRKGKIQGTSWNTGATFYAADAQAIGLIDGIKNFDQVVFRMGRMISAQNKQSQPQTSNMANENTSPFANILAAAGIQAIDVVDGGFLLDETHLNAIEAAMANYATELAGIRAANTDLATQLQTAQAAVTAANSQLQAANDRITAFEVLQGGEGAKPGAVTKEPAQKEADPWAEFRTSVDDEKEKLKAMMT